MVSLSTRERSVPAPGSAGRSPVSVPEKNSNATKAAARASQIWLDGTVSIQVRLVLSMAASRSTRSCKYE